jgi:hypothetical protein
MQQQYILIKIGRGARNAPYHLMAEDGVNPLCGVEHDGENYIHRLIKTVGERRLCRACARACYNYRPPRCGDCGSHRTQKRTISGIAEYRCKDCEQLARIAERQEYAAAIAKGATWLTQPAVAEELQLNLFDQQEVL